MQRIGNTAAPDTEHQPEFFMCHADFVSTDAVMIEKDPTCHSPFDGMSQGRYDRAPHLAHQHAGKTQKNRPDMRLSIDRRLEMIGSQPHGYAVLGTHHDIVWPAIVAEEDWPADEPLPADQGDRILSIVFERIEYGSNAGQREADAIRRVTSACDDVAITERNPFEMRPLAPRVHCRTVGSTDHCPPADRRERCMIRIC